MNRTELHHQQRGTSTLEFIVVLPILLLVFFAIMELSRAYLTVHITTTAAREGARLASVTPPDAGGNFDTAPALGRINAVLTSANITPDAGGINVTCNAAPCETDSQVTATVQVTFATVMPIILEILEEVVITRTTIMRYE